MKKDFKYDKKYFNSWEFEHACSLIECNPQMALIELSEYIEKYPKDYAAYHAYIDVLTILGKFDEAEKMIEYCERLVNDNSHFANFFDKVQKVNYHTP